MKKSDIASQRYLEMLETACGPKIMGFFHDPEVIEIMLNPSGELFIDRLGKGKSATGIRIPREQSENIIKLVASYKNLVIHEQSPVIDTDDYVRDGMITPEQKNFLTEAVFNHKNILVAGGTGSGKTTFANALLALLNTTGDRILVLEDLPELQVMAEDVVTMTTTPTVSMADLVKGSLRMRPDRIIVGEVRDGAALDLLKAWNTGHPGGLCTLHANSIESTPYRLEDLIREVSVTIPHYLIAEAIDIIIFIERLKDGSRKIRDIGTMSTEKNNASYTFERIV